VKLFLNLFDRECSLAFQRPYLTKTLFPISVWLSDYIWFLESFVYVISVSVVFHTTLINKSIVIRKETTFYNNSDLLFPNLNTSVLQRISILCFEFLGKNARFFTTMFSSFCF
jgi:hypothetical protein